VCVLCSVLFTVPYGGGQPEGQLLIRAGESDGRSTFRYSRSQAAPPTVPIMFTLCSQTYRTFRVHSVFTQCSLSVHSALPKRSLRPPKAFTPPSQSVHSILPKRSLSLPKGSLRSVLVEDWARATKPGRLSTIYGLRRAPLFSGGEPTIYGVTRGTKLKMPRGMHTPESLWN
jgi:hypothetical protein